MSDRHHQSQIIKQYVDTEPAKMRRGQTQAGRDRQTPDTFIIVNYIFPICISILTVPAVPARKQPFLRGANRARDFHSEREREEREREREKQHDDPINLLLPIVLARHPNNCGRIQHSATATIATAAMCSFSSHLLIIPLRHETTTPRSARYNPLQAGE